MPNKYTTYDLISTALEQKPLEFNGTFNDLMLDRIDTIIDDIKRNVAQTMFNSPEVPEADNAVEEE